MTIVSGVTLLSSQKKQLERLISQIFLEKINMHYEVDQKIFGGLKISSEEIVIDASLLAQFNQFTQFCRDSIAMGLKYENCSN